MPLHVLSTCVHHQEVKIASHNLWYHHTYRWQSGAQVERGLFHASTCFEHMCSSCGGQNCITQPLLSSDLYVAVSCTRLREEYFMPLHVSSTCAHHQEVKIVLHNLWYHQTYRWPSGAQVERGLFHASTCFEHMCSSR